MGFVKDQTLRVQIRKDHRHPSFHAPTRASRRICLFANALHALPHAAMVIHVLPRAGTVFPRAGSTSHALPRALAPSHARLHAPTPLLAREMHALRSHQAFARAIHAPSVPLPHALTDTCTTRARRYSSLSNCHVSLRVPPCQP
jgi:hypothetical protein